MEDSDLDIVRKFYEAFAELDASLMTSFYSDKVIFEDPAFGELKGERAKNMWKMLITSQKGKDFDVELKKVEKGATFITANWEARYVFSKTKRPVHNKITAKIKVEDGLIVEHHDYFDLYKWAKQALGRSGFLIGWTPFFQKKLQSQTNSLLDKYEASLP